MRTILPLLTLALLGPPAGAAAQSTFQDKEARAAYVDLARPVLFPAPALGPAELTLEVPRGASAATLRLTRHDVRAGGYTLRAWSADGETRSLPAEPAALYRGTVDGDPRQPVVASVRQDGVRAWALADGVVAWRLVPAPETPAACCPPAALRHVVLEGAGLPTAPAGCGPVTQPLTAAVSPGSAVAGATTSAGALRSDLRASGQVFEGTCQREVEIAFDADFEYFQLKGGSVQAVADEIEAYVALVDLFYARDLRVTFRLTDVIVRTAPFYAPTSGGSLLDLFRFEWNANQGAVPRDIAHLMTGKPGSLIEFGGLAYVGVACNLPWAYGWSMDGANIVGHEVGHNLGAGHCHDVDPCNTMCGACFLVGPNTKDIMNAYLGGQGCLDAVPFHPLPLAPYPYPDRAVVLKDELQSAAPFAFDVTANDEDGNCEPVSIAGFDATSARGGSVTLSPGTAPGGGDELYYTPPPTTILGLDTFEYTAADGTGQTSAGTVTVDVRPLALSAYWPLDDVTGGTTPDAGPNALNGSVVGATSTFGPFGGALDFDGVNDHVDAPALNLDTDRATFTAWIRRDGDQTSWSGLLVTREGSTIAGLLIGPNNELRYTWADEPGTFLWSTGLVPPDGQWAFVALVVEPERATMYLDDGTLRSAVNVHAHGTEAFDGATRIGWNPSSNARRFDGALDDVRAYGYALDAAAIGALAALGGPADLPTPVDGGRLPFATASLTWVAGLAADSHDVYFGQDEGLVATATTSSLEFLGNQPQTSRFVGGLVPDTPYFWRVDERVGASVLPGQVWQFELARANRWALDETGGTLALDSGDTSDGTYVGAPTLGQPGATAALGTSVDFDGVDDRVAVPALNLDSDTVTFTAWIRRDGPQTPWAGLIFSRAGNTTAGLNFGEADELRYHWNGGQWPWNSGLIVPDAQWVFVALVVEPSRGTLYLHDGVGWQSAVNVAAHTPEEFDGATQLGWDQGFGSRRFDGRLDDVRIFRSALSASELEALRQASL